jgi:hypothetical protein
MLKWFLQIDKNIYIVIKVVTKEEKQKRGGNKALKVTKT